MSSGDRLRLACCGLHPDRVRGLIAEWGNAAAVLRAIDRRQIDVTDAARSAAAVESPSRLAQLEGFGVVPVLRGGAGFPAPLAELPDSPDLLFVRGRLPDGPAVGVVGTRRCSGYGRGLARAIGSAVADAGWPTVSGLARGVDGAAHEGTVAASGVGVAVLGSGPDVWYPREHRSLGERLIELGGAVVTEYPPGTVPEGWRFPPRNRIISGLAAAVVVVEAGLKGGALITAAAALDQGRSVFAVPGDVDRESSVGCNLLIRDGAHPVLGPDDLIVELSLVLGPPPAAKSAARAVDDLASIVGRTGRTLEWLAEALNRPVTEVLAHVARLEAAGVLRRSGEVVVAV